MFCRFNPTKAAAPALLWAINSHVLQVLIRVVSLLMSSNESGEAEQLDTRVNRIFPAESTIFRAMKPLPALHLFQFYERTI
jgi:hypothetical protein